MIISLIWEKRLDSNIDKSTLKPWLKSEPKKNFFTSNIYREWISINPTKHLSFLIFLSISIFEQSQYGLL